MENAYKNFNAHTHHFVDPADIKEEIENLGHKVTNIWNIKQYRTPSPRSL
jgi:hypothetical protein